MDAILEIEGLTKVYAGGLGKAPVAIFSAPAGTAVGPDPAPARNKTL